MGKVSRDSVKCSGCGYLFGHNQFGACPRCSDTRKTHSVHIEATLDFSGSLRRRYIHNYYEKWPILLAVVIMITFPSPFLGLVLAGWAGVIVGLLIGLATYFMGVSALMKVREIHEEA